MKYIKKYRKIIALLLVFVFVTNDMHIALAGNLNFINKENIENIDIDSDIEDSDIENTESEEDGSAALELEESEMPLTTPLYEDMEIDGNITLDEDMVINNLILNEKAVLNLNGYVLTVMGNAELNGGTLEFNNGILTCENDVDIDRKVTVKMDKINDRLVVKGNLHVYGMRASSGTVSLYGDFIADSTVRLSDNNKFVFEGNEKQTISINTESNFNILELKNFSEEGIFIDYALKYNQLIDNNCIVTYNDLDGARGFKLEEDTQIDGMFYLTIDKLDLNGYTLTVNGDFIQAGGEVDLNNGTLIVKGDYVVARLVKDEINEDGETTYNYEAGNGTLTMDDANDYLLVEGSYVNNKNNNCNVTLTEGVMEVKGDFNTKYLCASGNHTLTFSGEEKQNIDMNYTSFSLYNYYIKNLNFQNTSDEGIILSKDLNVCGCIRQNNTKVDGRLVIYSSVTFPENRYTGDLYIYNLNCTAPMTVYGDVEIDSMTVNNGMDIYGDVTVKSLELYDDVNIYGNISGGTVSLRGSNIYVKGDSLNTYYSDYTNTENTVMIDGNVSLNGSSLDDSELTVKKDISTSKETDIKKLVLCGDKKQKISNAYYFNLGTLVLENYSEEGIHADNIINSEEIISNELSITYDNFDDAISGWTLEKDEVYDGDLVMIGGELNLNGHKLTVTGDLIQQDGTININHGELDIEGTYRTQIIANSDRTKFITGKAAVIMNNSDDKIILNNLVWDTNIDNSKTMTNGQLEIKGDIDTARNVIFPDMGNGNVILNGEKKQTIDLKSDFIVNNLEINNASKEGIIISNSYGTVLGVKKNYNDHDSVVIGAVAVYAGTVFADDKFSPSMFIAEPVTISNNITILGNVSLKYQIGKLIINNACINVKGNYSEDYSLGLVMKHKNDKLKVDGKFSYYNNYYNNSELTDGVISVKGKCTLSNYYKSSGNHKLLLNGDTAQELVIYDKPYVNILEIDNKSEEGVIASAFFDKGEIITNGCKFRYKGIEGEIGWKLQDDEEFDGDLTLIDGKLDLNGHTLTVHGNYNQPAGELYLNGGKLVVEEDFRLQNITKKLKDGRYDKSVGFIQMDETEDEIIIYGNAYLYNETDKNIITAGTINLYKDLYIEYSGEGKNYTSGNALLCFMGNEKQSICGYTDTSVVTLHNVRCDKPEGKNIETKCKLYISGCLDVSRPYFESPIYVAEGFSFKNNTFYGALNIDKYITLSQDLTIHGNLSIDKSRVTGNNINIYCDGDVDITKSTLDGCNLILNGTKKQNINTTGSTLDVLTINNSSEEGVFCDSYVKANAVYDESGNFNYPYVTGYMLEEDTVIDGDLYLGYGTLDLNGHKLTINGDLIQGNCCIDVNKGSLYVKGNYEQRIRSGEEGNYTYTDSTGHILMERDEDYVLVEGDLFIQFIAYRSNVNVFNGGTIELKGNLNTLTTYDYGAIYKGIDNTVIKLSGDKKQEIDYNLKIGTLILDNRTSVKIYGRIDILKRFEANGTKFTGGSIGVSDISRLADDTYNGNITITGDVILDRNLFVNGTLCINENMDLNGYEVDADNITINSKVKLNKGRINCIKTIDINNMGELIMTGENDYIYVGKSMNFNSYKTHENLLTAGTIEISGDFVQNNYDNFTPSGTHKTIINKKSITGDIDYIHTLKFSASDGVSKFNKLILKERSNMYDMSRDENAMAAEIIYEGVEAEPPAAPKTIKKTGVTVSSITLEFVPEDNEEVMCYEIIRDGVRVAATDKATYTDRGLNYNTEYTYDVYVYDKNMNKSLEAKSITVRTADDTEKPSTPLELSLIYLSGSRLSIKFTPSEDNFRVAGYKVYRNGEYIASTDTCEYEDAGLEVGSQYEYKIKAYDDAGNESDYSEPLTLYTVKPVIKDIKPENYKKLNKKSEKLYLYFKNYGYNESYNIRIEYYDEKNKTWIAVSDKPYEVQSYNLETDYVCVDWNTSKVIQNETKVKYTITDVDGNSVSETKSYYIDNMAPPKPDKPEILSDNGIISISWNASIASDFAGYKVYRRDDLDNDIESDEYECIYTGTAQFETAFKDLNVETGAFYEYRVMAYDEDGNESEWSDSVKARASEDNKPPVVKSATPEAGKVNGIITIKAVANDNKEIKSVKYEIREENEELWTYLGESDVEQSTKNTGEATFNLDTGNYEDGIYFIKITAIDKAGNESTEEFTRRYETDNTGISKINITGTSTGCNYVQLRWDEATETDLDYYAVEQFRNGSFERITISKGILGCNITNLAPNTYYRFRVVGYDKLGNRGIESDVESVYTSRDDIPPVIKNVEPVSSYYGDSIDIKVTAKDNYMVGGVIISYSFDGENYEFVEAVGANNAYSEPVMAYKLDTSDFPEGELYVRYEVYDMSGNKNMPTEDGEEVTVKYIIDHTRPEKTSNLNAVSGSGYVELNWDEAKEKDIESYKIYRADISDGVFRCVNDHVRSRNYYDENVEPGNSYMYKIVACDIAGNCSEESDAAVVNVSKDTIKPVITGVSPESGATVGKNSTIYVIALDNSLINYVDFEFLTEDNIWIKYDSKSLSGRGGMVESSLCLDNLPEKTYSIRIRAVDESGNYGDYVYVDYKLDINAPDIHISAETGNYNIKLSISTAEEYAYMELYRKVHNSDDAYEKIAQIEELEYFDEDIEPYTNYEYMVRLYDSYDNYRDSEPVVCFADDNDVISPVAVIPEQARVRAGFEIRLDGGESYDNIDIVSYEWDMGNGDVITGPYPKYIYDNPGVYSIKLTVTDAAGNTGTSVCETEVVEADGTGTVEIVVMDSNGFVIPYAFVYLNEEDEEGNTGCYKADANGTAYITAPVGEYKVAAYKQGYLPKDMDITINEYITEKYSLIINKGDLVIGEIKAHQMTIQEMVDAGVDFSNPANYHNFVFNVTLGFAERAIPIEFEYVGGGGISGSYGGSSGGIGVKYRTGNGNGIGEDHGIDIKPVEVKTENGIIEVPLITYLNTTHSVSWLKDMYMVELGVLNMADAGYVIEDAYASLNMPKGLSLAAINKGQSQSQYMGDIKGQEKQFTSWIVKTDNPGRYKVTADFTGTLMPFEAPVNAHFDSDTYINSEGYSGLSITVMPEETAYTGELYYIQFKIENDSGRPLYNFSTSFGPYIEPGLKYESFILDPETGEKEEYESFNTGSRTYSELSELSYTPVIKGGERIKINTLEAGQVIYGTYVTSFPGTADPDEAYYELVEKMVDVLEGEELGVSVYVKPISGHISKNIFCFMPKESIFGDPVDMSTGAYVDEYEALSLSGVSELSLDLSYNSRFGNDAGEVGCGWTHNFESYISNDCGMLHLYTSPACQVSFINEESYNGDIYGHMEDGELIPVDAEENKELVYKCITTGMEDAVITRKADGTYILTMPSGDVFTYGSDGKLSGMNISDGGNVSITHTNNQKIITEEGSGNRLILDYIDGKLISVSDDNGRKTYFAYTGNCLTSITNPMGEKIYYEYDDEGRITKSKNSIGQTFVENTYDEDGRVIRQLDYEGNEITMTYTDKENGGMVVAATDAIGAVTTYETDAACRVIKTTNPDGSSISNTYDKKGNLTLVTDESGNTVSYTYDEENRNTGVVASGGNISYTYDDKDRINSVNDGQDTTQIIYDENDNITCVKNDDKSQSYGYDDKDRLISVTREGKGEIKYGYDGESLLVNTLTNELGSVMRIDYDQRGNMVKTTDPEGFETLYEYDLMNRLTAVTYPNKSTRKVTYDIYGNPASITDGRGFTTYYEYNVAGNLIKTTYPDNTTEEYEYNARGELVSVTGVDKRKISYEYDPAGNLTRINYPDGTSESYEYSIKGQATAITGRDEKSSTLSYTSDGKLSDMTISGNNTYAIGYDGNNRISSFTDEDGNTVSYTYDSYGNLSGITDELGYTTTYEYNCWDELLSIKDPNGNKTMYGYDASGCANSIIYPDGTEASISYDKNGRPIRISFCATNENKTVSVSYTYDEMGNVSSYTDEMGVNTYYEYDLDGNLIKVLDYERNPVALYEYDCMNRVISEKAKDGSGITYKYDVCGNIIQADVITLSGETKTYVYTYDEDNILTDVTDAAGISAKQNHDKLGYITDITYPEGGGISYTYDDMHRLTKETISIGTEYSYEYNSDNLLSKYTNGRGQETTYEYDKLGRITSATDELGTISYTYDGCGNVLTVSETDNDGNTSTISRTYDCMNRISSYTDYKGNTVKYGYDELGNLISLTYAGGEIVRYKYYDNGALKEVIDTENLITSYTYDKRGNLLTTTNSDGTVEVNTYDELSRLATRTLYKAAAGEEKRSGSVEGATEGSAYGGELYSYSYTYDDSGNITGITYKDNLSGNDNTSDGLLGDVKNETDILESSTMTYDSSNRMITYNGKTVEYDDDGNMTYGPLNGRMVKFEYDCRNRLIKAGDTEYTYDAENIRTSTKTPYYTEEYITDSSGTLSRVLEVDRVYNNKQVGYNKDNSGKNFDHEVYYYGNGLAYEKTNDDTYTYHYDHLGSTKLITDRAGKSVCKFDYGTYGELLTTEYLSGSDYGTDKDSGDYVLHISFLYNGQYGVITDDNGLYYMRSRYYNPEIKRFINQDILTGSIGNSASLNRYSYVEGNPVSYTDPFGLSPFSYMSGWIKIPKSIHIALECLGCIPGCDVFDYINAGLYLLEGDVNGVIRALPVANLFGKYSNYFIKGTRILSFGMCGFGEDLLKNVRINCTPDIDTLNNLIGMNALGMHSTMDTPQIKTSDDVIPNPNKNMEEELSYKNNENYGNTSGSTEFKGGRKTDFYVKPNGDVVPSTGYRYFAKNPSVLANAKDGKLLARTDGTYFSFDKYDDAIVAQGKLQIPYRPEYRVSFDTLDIIDDIHIPFGEWGSADYLEPITTSFRRFGPGKATQIVTYSEINSVSSIDKLR